MGISFLMLFGDDTKWSSLGVSLALVAGLSYALYSLCTSRIVKKISHHNTAAWTFLIAAFFLRLFYFYPSSWIISNEAIALIFRNICHWPCIFLFYRLKYLNSSTAVTLSLAEPVTAVFLAIIILGEFFSIAQHLQFLL